jgi:16S rRNA (guanine527-N7)-methyltransferase
MEPSNDANSPITPLTPTAEFLDAARELGVEFDPGDLERLGLYLALLLERNKVTNLTGIKDPDECWIRHILDSLTLLPLCAELPDGALIADVGSGGGAPALPLAIVEPRLHFTCIETTGKKADFLCETISELGLKNVDVYNERVETLGAKGGELRDRFDLVTARALGRIVVAAELTAPLAKIGGLVALIKGERAEEELDEAKQCLHRLCVSHVGTTQTPTGRIVAIEKSRPTPGMYPRKPGEPKRAPLGASSGQAK